MPPKQKTTVYGGRCNFLKDEVINLDTDHTQITAFLCMTSPINKHNYGILMAFNALNCLTPYSCLRLFSFSNSNYANGNTCYH